MPREIKFRAWDKTRNVMQFSGEDFRDSFFKDVRINHDKNYSEIMQFTGLLDKSGKEIYEKDILKTQTYTYGYRGKKANGMKFTIVSWVQNAAWTGFNIAEQHMKKYEIIGNIYENPELLT